jgi:hypothetical protein
MLKGKNSACFEELRNKYAPVSVFDFGNNLRASKFDLIKYDLCKKNFREKNY